jgi:hypothetical protein
MIRTKWVLTVAAVIALLVGTAAKGDEFVYWTNFNGQQLMKTDVTTSTTTVLESTPSTAGNPDSLIFDANGNLIYTEYTVYGGGGPGGSGEVRSFNLTTDADTLLVTTGLGDQTVDLALDPSGTTYLVSNRADNAVDRAPTAGGAITPLSTISEPDGIAYDTKTGGLYVLSGGTIVQINPTTGALIATSTFSSSFLDGLAYDAGSDTLYAAFNGCLQTFNPTTLAAGSCVGSFGGIDGVESDGNGNLLIADTGDGDVGNYHIATGASTILFSAPGLDDIAPLIGAGAPPVTTPEPSTLGILGIGLAGLALLGKFRRSQKAQSC